MMQDVNNHYLYCRLAVNNVSDTEIGTKFGMHPTDHIDPDNLN
jgi:hypothetical protein